jgi:hypothetical protein
MLPGVECTSAGAQAAMLGDFLSPGNSCAFHYPVNQLHFFLGRQLFASDFNRRTWLNGGGSQMLPMAAFYSIQDMQDVLVQSRIHVKYIWKFSTFADFMKFFEVFFNRARDSELG